MMCSSIGAEYFTPGTPGGSGDGAGPSVVRGFVAVLEQRTSVPVLSAAVVTVLVRV